MLLVKRLWLLPATLILAMISVAIWQHRFEVVPEALPEFRLADPLVGWSANSRQQYQILEEDGQNILRLERKNPEEKFPGIGIWLGKLDSVDYLHTRCEARWENVVRGPRPYDDARFTITSRTRDGSLHYPPEGRIFNGTGTSGWRRAEVVFGLTPDVVDSGVRLGMGGASGRLDVRNLSLVAVRQRPWVPFAIAVTLIGWACLIAAFIRGNKFHPSWFRTLTAATLAIGCSWFFIFPQARDHFHPLIGQFSITGLPVLPELPDSVAVSAAEGIPGKTPEERHVEINDEHRTSTFHHLLRNLDKEFKGLHFVLFFSFTLTFMLITGHLSQWPLPVIMAVLGELVPELTDHLGGWDDWADLVENLAGVGIALVLWSQLPLLKRFRMQLAV